MAEAIFAGGCFWCTEAVFKQLDGVLSVESGYIGGSVENPDYKSVCSGTTSHAEAIRIGYEPDVIGYADLLDIHFATHDPTQLNRQGNDIGTQYRSGIYVYNEAQKQAALASLARYQDELKKAGFPPITTEILDAPEFYYAEDYHQQYLAKNPRGYCGHGGTGVTCPL